MKESVHQFGQGRHLAGIVTEPDAPSRRVGCVLVSAGLVPKAGPYRLYAQLARRLAREGFTTLRFDLGGIGDSRQELAGLPLRERTALEIRAAIDLLAEQHGLERVVLGGLCSGAEDAFRHAEHDPRVAGVVLIDPFSWPTPGWRRRYLAYRAIRRSLRLLGLYQPIARTSPEKSRPLVNYRHMERAESSRILRALIARGAHAHFIYTGGEIESFNHPSQLQAMFAGIDFNGLVTLDHFPQTSHTQALEGDRRTLIEAITARLAAAYRSEPVARARPAARAEPAMSAPDSMAVAFYTEPRRSG